MSRNRTTAVLLGGYLLVSVLALVLAPWWSLAVVSFGFGLLWRAPSPGLSFWPGLLVGALAFGLGALWYGSGGGLADMLGELFGVGSAGGFYAVTALAGGLLAGTCAMAGAYLGAVVRPTTVPQTA